MAVGVVGTLEKKKRKTTRLEYILNNLSYSSADSKAHVTGAVIVVKACLA